MTKDINKIVLAYSGGLDTSVILKWLKQTYNCEVITLTADLGQKEELDGLEKKALETGASKAYILDLREEFARDYIFPAFRGAAIYENGYLLGTSIARPLISKKLVEIAQKENAQAISHGATGKGNDQIRFELSAKALAPEIKCIAPWRIWDLNSRTALLDFAKKHNIPTPVTKDKPYSCDRNLLHLSFEGGELEFPEQEAKPASHMLCVPVEQAPDKPEIIDIQFECGNPISVNNEKLSPATLIEKLNILGGKHGIGRIDIVENRFIGMKSRGIYETPGGTILYTAHRDLEGLCMDRELLHLRNSLVPRYASMIYNGFWFSPEREALQAFMDKSQENISGSVTLKLYKGGVYPISRTSKNSLYNTELASFEAENIYTQSDATGFIQLQGLRLVAAQKVKK